MNRLSITTQAIAGIPALFYCFALQKTMPTLDPLSPAVFDPFITGCISNCTCALAAIFLAAAAKRCGGRALRHNLLVSGTLAQILYSALYFASPFVHPIMIPIIASAATALRSIGIVFISALWIDLCVSLNPVRASFLNAVSIVLSLALHFFVLGLDDLRVGILSFLLPLVIAFCCHRAQQRYRTADDDAPATPPKRRVPLLPRTALFVAVYSLTSAVITSSIATEHSRFASLVPAMIIIFFILFQARQFNIAVLYRIAFPLMVGGFLLASVVTSSFLSVSGIILDAASAAMGMMLLLVVWSLSYSVGASALRLFGMLGAVQFAASLAGNVIGESLRLQIDSTGSGILFAIVTLAVVLVSCFFMSEDSLRSFWGHRQKESDSDSGESESSRFALRISSLSVSYSLTEREAEILLLLAQGRSNADMAAALFISESTVKTHLHHIYQKFGVHTRRELEDRILKEKR